MTIILDKITIWIDGYVVERTRYINGIDKYESEYGILFMDNNTMVISGQSPFEFKSYDADYHMIQKIRGSLNRFSDILKDEEPIPEDEE